MDFNVLCYDSDDNVLMATTSQNINSNDYVEILGQSYKVTEAGSFATTMSYSSKVIYLEKFKEKRKKVG